MKKYGRSLSFCVKDILSGKVSLEDVGVIVTSTECKTNDDWERLLELYSNSYWRSFPKNDARNILYSLIDNGNIYQPRLVNGMCQSLVGVDNWCDTYQEALATLVNYN